MGSRLGILLLLSAVLGMAQPKRVLYLTHSAGYRHESIPLSIEVLREIAQWAGTLEIVATEDIGQISAERLRVFDAVLFFTSGELPLSAGQKVDLLDFVRSGKGFGAVHSATDTLYTWPEYGELIGGRFDGHPWVQEVLIDIEDPEHPAVRHLAPSFSIVEEIYQHKDISRNQIRVLMSLDTSSVDLGAVGVKRKDNDFPLAWVRPYGKGRVFYSALGHFDHTWRDERFQMHILNALLWLTQQANGASEARPPAQPLIWADAVGNSATMLPPGVISPGSLVSIYGENLTPGSSLAARAGQPAQKLAGATVRMNGQVIPILYASPGQINAVAPFGLEGAPCSRAGGQCAQIDVVLPGTAAASALAAISERTPGVFAVTRDGNSATLWATGLGGVRASRDLFETVWRPRVIVNGTEAPVLFSGLAPGWTGLYQVNVLVPPGLLAEPRLEWRLVE